MKKLFCLITALLISSPALAQEFAPFELRLQTFEPQLRQDRHGFKRRPRAGVRIARA